MEGVEVEFVNWPARLDSSDDGRSDGDQYGTIVSLLNTYPGRILFVATVAKHPEHGVIAAQSGYCISKEDQTKKSEEVHDWDLLWDVSLALRDVFDSSGHIYPHLHEGYRSGSGCWKDELNEGELYFIESIEVKEQFRRRGVGSFILKELFKSEKPYPMDTFWFDRSRCDIPVPFLHANGFRRVGRTDCFAYSMDPGHPSKLLKPSDDITQSLREAFPYERSVSFSDPGQIYQQEHPLHVAIRNDHEEKIVSVIHEFYSNDPSSVHLAGNGGFLPVHVAVQAENVSALHTLLSLGCVTDLDDPKNIEGKTVLEILESRLAYERKLRRADSLEQISAACLSMGYEVKHALGLDTHANSREEYVMKNRFGCICGRCADGWLSPRMASLLIESAELLSDTRYNYPTENPSVRKANHGFARICDAVVHILEQTPIQPGSITSEGIRTRALTIESLKRSRSVEHYLSHHGNVDDVLAEIIRSAMDEEDDAEDDDLCSLLPKCVNDDQFDLVAEQVEMEDEWFQNDFVEEVQGFMQKYTVEDSSSENEIQY